MKDIKEFAEHHHLRVKRDECGDSIIPGTHGHIGDGYGDSKLVGGLRFALLAKRGAFFALEINVAEACGSRIHHPFREGTRRRL